MHQGAETIRIPARARLSRVARASRNVPRMSTRKLNFNAGPGALPAEVLAEIATHIADHHGLGLSLLEMSHRTPEFEGVLNDARDTLARLYGLPDTHEVVFLQGGASLQFAMLPMNLGTGGAYVTTGVWSQKALEEARRLGEAHELWTAEPGGFRAVPGADEVLQVPEGARYLHYTTNNTIYGTQWHHAPRLSRAVPLIADVSSDFLSYPMDLGAYDLVYAGAQKNAGPSGVTIVIGRRDVLRGFNGDARTPTILRYATHAKNDSLYHTPNTFGIWVVGLVARWVERQGGLPAMAALAEAKAGALYGALDARPDLFRGHAEAHSRSRMNVTFTLARPAREKAFLAEAERRDMIGLKGHRSVGGCRASIYNAVPRSAVDALVDLLATFE